MKTVRLIIKGKVQGVFYRAFAKNLAEQLHITGWTKNLPDRTVEIKATATEEALKNFIYNCKQGPPKAIVDELVIEEQPTEQFNDFKIIR